MFNMFLCYNQSGKGNTSSCKAHTIAKLNKSHSLCFFWGSPHFGAGGQQRLLGVHCVGLDRQPSGVVWGICCQKKRFLVFTSVNLAFTSVNHHMQHVHSNDVPYVKWFRLWRAVLRLTSWGAPLPLQKLRKTMMMMLVPMQAMKFQNLDSHTRRGLYVRGEHCCSRENIWTMIWFDDIACILKFILNWILSYHISLVGQMNQMYITISSRRWNSVWLSL